MVLGLELPSAVVRDRSSLMVYMYTRGFSVCVASHRVIRIRVLDVTGMHHATLDGIVRGLIPGAQVSFLAWMKQSLTHQLHTDLGKCHVYVSSLWLLAMQASAVSLPSLR